MPYKIVWQRIRKTVGYYGGIKKEAKLIIIISSLTSLPYSFLLVIQSIYLEKAGIDLVSIGILYTVFGLVSSTFAIPSGILSDRYGRKTLLALGIFLQVISYLIYIFTIDYSLLFISGMMGGAGSAMFYPSSSALLAEKAYEGKMTMTFSLSFFVSTSTYTIGALFSGLPVYFRVLFDFPEVLSYRPMFAISSFFLILSFIPLALIKEDKIYRAKRKFLPRKSLKIIAKFSLTNILVGIGAGLIIPLFSLWFYLNFGVDEVVLGPLYASVNGVMALSYLIAPKLSDSLGMVNSIVLTIGMSTGLIVIIPFVDNYSIVAILFIIRAFLMNVSNPILLSFIMGMVTPEERGSASGITGVAWNLPYAITATFGGYIFQHISLYLPFLICSVFYTASIILFYGFFRKSKRGNDQKT
ncbi:MAG: MFS transporter [Candidatus Methylarchaceae archaeon HK02M2]|nr:MFS transporter [Candidatus Methylarchaceae archaeon HK02M2]